MEKPLVSTTIGAEGLPVRDGEHLLLADTPDAFADAVVRLLRDPALRWQEWGNRAADLVRREFGWEGATRKFEQFCRRAIERCGQRNGAERLAGVDC